MMLIFRKYLFPGSICIDVKRDAIIIKNRMLQQNKHVFDSDWNCEKKIKKPSGSISLCHISQLLRAMIDSSLIMDRFLV